MSLTRKRAIWIALESGGYGVDPSTDGSGYKSVPAFGPIPMVVDLKSPLATEYATGRQYPTAPIAGPDGWSLDGIEIPLVGLATAAGDGVNASTVTDDWLDLILTHILGTQRTTPGEGVASSTSSTLTLDTDSATIQDLVPVFEAALPSSSSVRTQWALITVDNADGSYSVAPNWTANPTTAAIAYGAKIYNGNDAGGYTLSVVIQDDDVYYLLSGGRISSFGFSSEMTPTGVIVKARMSLMGDTKTEQTSTKTALPAWLAAPATTPIKGLLSPVFFGGTQYQTRRIDFDLGLATETNASTAATNGRAGMQNVTMRPSLTIEPLRTDAIQNLRRNATQGRVLVQLGSGVVSGSPAVLNGMAVSFSEGSVIEAADSGDGIARKTVTIQATDPIYFSGSTIDKYVQVARA